MLSAITVDQWLLLFISTSKTMGFVFAQHSISSVVLLSCRMESPTTQTPTRTGWENSRSTYGCFLCCSASCASSMTNATKTVRGWTPYLQRWDMVALTRCPFLILIWRVEAYVWVQLIMTQILERCCCSEHRTCHTDRSSSQGTLTGSC